MHEGAQLAMLAILGEGWKGTFATGGMHLSQTAGAALITAIWQSVLVAACLGLSLRMSKRVSAGLRFLLWAAGFLAVLGLPFLPLLIRQTLGHGVLTSSAAGTAQSWLQLDERWSIAIAIVWAAASLYRAIDLVAHAVKLRRLWKSATPMEERPIAVARLWGRKTIEICACDALDRPSVIGFLAPRILIPTWLGSQITREELEQIILHETEHLRRGDDWTNLLQKLSLILFPLNPVLLWIERQLCLEREMACDEAVIRATRAPKAYAACLTSLAERGLERRFAALSLGAWQRKSELVQRVHSILLRRQLLGPLATRSVTALMAGGLLMGTVELARCPQLVTFTAASHKQLSAQSSPASGAIETGADQVFRDGPHAMPVKAAGIGNVRMVESRAIMPVRTGVPFGPTAATMRKPWNEQRVPKLIRSHSRQVQPRLPSHQAEGETLKADLDGGQPFSRQESDYVVFTAWEEIAPPSNGISDTVAAEDFGSAKASPVTDAKPDFNTEKMTRPGKVTVTRFVFRVVTASYRSSSQAIVPLRDGWLVIQL